MYQVAYPYVAKRLLTDPNPALRERLIQVSRELPSEILSIYSFGITYMKFVYTSNQYAVSACQVLFKDGLFQWKRLENLIVLAKENVAKMSINPALQAKQMSVYFHVSNFLIVSITSWEF